MQWKCSWPNLSDFFRPFPAAVVLTVDRLGAEDTRAGEMAE